MIIINDEIKERGLCRKLVENGSGDIKVKCGDNIIISVKSILRSNNKILKKLIDDEQFSGLLELYEDCEEIGYFEIEKYYSGGEMNIYKENVCEILLFCVCYEEEYICEKCFEFIKYNIDDDMLIKLIDISNQFPNSLKEVEELKLMEFEKRGYKYLYNRDYLNVLEMNNMSSLLSFQNVIIRNESWLLNELLEWYKLKLSNKHKNDDDFICEFKYLIKDHFDNKLIDVNELKRDNKEILKELNIKFNKNKSLKYIDLYKIKDERIQNIIIDNYEENEMIEFSEENKEILDSIEDENELNNAICSLLETNDIKVIEIVLMIIIYKNIKIEKYISNIDKRNILSKLCVEYNDNVCNRILKCLSLFVEDQKNLNIIEGLCGKQIVSILTGEDKKDKIINEKKSKKVESDTKVEENTKKKVNKRIKKVTNVKEITSFSYGYTQFGYGLNEDMKIIPSFDGEKCEFSVNPSLPNGIMIDKESGVIYGRVDKPVKKKYYEISCKNASSEKKIKMLLEFVDIKFTKLYKNEYISITNYGKLITNTESGYNHCYLNMRMDKGVYHLKYRLYQNGCSYDDLFIGLSTTNKYNGGSICCEKITCNYVAYTGRSQDIFSYCHIGTVINENPNYKNHGDGSIYEVIVDMNKREFWISHNDSPPVLLVKDLPSPLYPYAIPFNQNTSVELLSISFQN